MNNEMPKKPKSLEDQIDTLWDIVANHILSRLHWQDIKLNFIMGLVALILALVSILIARG